MKNELSASKIHDVDFSLQLKVEKEKLYLKGLELWSFLFQVFLANSVT